MGMHAFEKTVLMLALAALAGCRQEQEAPGGKVRAPEAAVSEAADSEDGASGRAEGGTGEAEESPIVTLSDGSLRNMDLETETALPGSLELKLKVPGRLVTDANRTARVSATLEGRVTRLVRDVGDRVAQGAVMGQLETPELLDRPLVLHAPLAGVVTERSVSVGELAEKGQALYVISDPARLWLLGEAKERDVAKVRAGQKVDFTVAAYPGVEFHGSIARVGTSVEAETRTFEVRVEVDNRDGRLKPGMFAEMAITTGIVNDALLASDAAVQTEGEGKIAFVALDGNRFEKRRLKTGLEAGGRVQILEGIRAGERVVTEGSFTLKSELLKGELGEE
jgi:multidrug efflux pump subunit AcrA (membrane-fusion protein)